MQFVLWTAPVPSAVSLSGAAFGFDGAARNRIRRLIDPLAPDDPARIEGERQIGRLEVLANHSGDPRGMGRDDEPALHDEGGIPGGHA